MIDSNGLVAVTQSKGLLSGDVEYTGAEQPQVSMSSLVRAVLDKLTDAACIVVDPVTRKVFASDATANICTPALLGCSTKAKVFAPHTGQTGRPLTWEAGVAGDGFPSAVDAAVDPIVDAAAPKRTLESLVNALIQNAPDGLSPLPVYVVSQTAKTVSIIESGTPSAIPAGLDAIVSGATGDAVKITLSETSEESSPLPFEGGAV